jgi:6-phosphogluconolactonase (cycloisomerase 2 family)
VSTQSGIFLYNIASDGTLTLANTQAISQDPATSMQVDATNSWLVDVVSGIGSVNAISIDPTTGALASNSEQSFPLPSEYPFQVAVSPTDSSSCTDCYAFVAMQTGGTEVIHFNPASAQPFTSSIGTLKLVNANSSDNAVAVDPQNRLLYVGETIAVSGTQTGGLRAFTISSSGVSEIAGSPFASGGTAPSSILPTADGSYVYVANGSVSGNADGNITGFSVTATSLTAIGTTAAGPSGRLGLAEDSTGSYLLAIDSAGGPDLQAYTMSSGALTSAVTDPTGTDPVKAIGIAALP